MQFFEGTVSEAAHHNWGNLQRSLCSHSQDTPCSSPPECESHQKEKRVMSHCRLHSEFSPKLPARCLHHHNIGQLRLPLLAQIHRLPTSWCRHRLQSRELKIPHETASVPSPSQPHVSECAEASRSEELTETGIQELIRIKIKYWIWNPETIRNSPKLHRETKQQLQWSGWLSTRISPTVFLRGRRSHPTEVHLRGTRLLPALATVDPRFRTHPESSPPEKDFLGPGLQGASIIISRCLSSSSSGSGLPLKSNNRQPGVTRRSRWSRAKWRCPWKCRIISYPPRVRTNTSFRHNLQ